MEDLRIAANHPVLADKMIKKSFVEEVENGEEVEKKEQTEADKKEQARKEYRAKVSNERLVYMSMPTKQLIEIVQAGQQKEHPAMTRSEAYKRAEQMVENKVNRLA